MTTEKETKENKLSIENQLPPEGKFTLELNGNKFLADISDTDISLAKIGGEEKLKEYLTKIALSEHSAKLAEERDAIKEVEKEINQVKEELDDVMELVSNSASDIAERQLSSKINDLVNAISAIESTDVISDISAEVRFKGKHTLLQWKLNITALSGVSFYQKRGTSTVNKDDLTAIDSIEDKRAIIESKRNEAERLRKAHEESALLANAIKEQVEVKVANYMLKYAGIESIK